MYQVVRRHWDFRFCGFGYFFRSVFRFWCSLRFADIPFSGIWFSVFAKNTNGFPDLIFDAVFGFSYLTDLGSCFSSIWVAITRHRCRLTQMLSRGMRDEPIEISQGTPGSLRVAVPSPSPKVGGKGPASLAWRSFCASRMLSANASTSNFPGKFVHRGTLPEFLHQRYLEVGGQVTGHTWLIQHSNRISKLSGLNSQIRLDVMRC